MVQEFSRSITVGISTSALFEMEDAKRLREKYGDDFYRQYMIEKEDEPLQPGYFFDVVKTMIEINNTVGHSVFDIVLLSTNAAWTGIRAVKSCAHHGIGFSCAMFGNAPLDPEYLDAYGVNWFITTNEDDAQKAQNMGIASCSVDPSVTAAVNTSAEINRILKGRMPQKLRKKIETPAQITRDTLSHTFNKKLHFVWDLDRVLFDGTPDDVFGKHGMHAYMEHESEHALQAITKGPFASIADVIGRLSQHFPKGESPIISSALTARGGVSTLRAMNSLRENGIIFNGELHFSGGAFLKDGVVEPKGIYKDRILKIMEKAPHSTVVFLDDSKRTIELTKSITTSGLVPSKAGSFAIGDVNQAAKKGSNDNKAAAPKPAKISAPKPK